MFLYVLLAVVLGGFVVNSLERYTASHVLMQVKNVYYVDGTIDGGALYIARAESPMHDATAEYDVYLLQYVGKKADGRYQFGPMWNRGGDFIAQQPNSAEYDLVYEVVCTKAGLEKPEEIGVEAEKANHKNELRFRVGDKMPKSFVLSCR